jgi:hypothetical protein
MSRTYICSRDGIEITGSCYRASASGLCPLAKPGEAVRCAGQTLLACAPDGKRALLLDVQRDAETCPLSAAGWAERARAVWPSAECAN